jgi:hypothetical protein
MPVGFARSLLGSVSVPDTRSIFTIEGRSAAGNTVYATGTFTIIQDPQNVLNSVGGNSNLKYIDLDNGSYAIEVISIGGSISGIANNGSTGNWRIGTAFSNANGEFFSSNYVNIFNNTSLPQVFTTTITHSNEFYGISYRLSASGSASVPSVTVAVTKL